MKKEMLINVLQPEECRIAIIEDGVLEELYVERASQESYVNNIYKGRIVNIEPSIQAAFVDFGIGRNGFLHVSDVDPVYYKHLMEGRGNGKRDRDDSRRDRGPRRDFTPVPIPSVDMVPPEFADEEPHTPESATDLPADEEVRNEDEFFQEGSFGEGLLDDGSTGPAEESYRPAPEPVPPQSEFKIPTSLPIETIFSRGMPLQTPPPEVTNEGPGTTEEEESLPTFGEGLDDFEEKVETEEFDAEVTESSETTESEPTETAESERPRRRRAGTTRSASESKRKPASTRKTKAKKETAGSEEARPKRRSSRKKTSEEETSGEPSIPADTNRPDDEMPRTMPSAERRTMGDENEGESFGGGIFYFDPTAPNDRFLAGPPAEANEPIEVSGEEDDLIEAEPAPLDSGDEDMAMGVGTEDQFDGDDDELDEEEFMGGSRRLRGDRGGRRRRGGPGGGGFGGRGGRDKPPIQEIFKRGQEVIVQVIKEGIGTKGPTLSTYISIAGRYLVLMPSLNRIAVSRKIADPDIRVRLKESLDELNPPKGIGFIIRTAAIDRNKHELRNDLTYLVRLWEVFTSRVLKRPAPVEIYRESDMITRTIRDIFTSDIDSIIVDEQNAYNQASEFLRIVMPRYADRLKHYNDTEPLFHRYKIEHEIAKINEKKLPLSMGGSIVIEQTEALVAIDVNSGNFRADNNAEETAYQMNLQAAKEIARQLRLRDLGGVIVNDFIDMKEEKHRRSVEQALRNALRRDRARTKILKTSAFGVIEMTRQRIRPSLKRSIYMECPHCRATGYVKTSESLSIEIMRLLQLAAHRKCIRTLNLKTHMDVAQYLLNKKRREIIQWEEAGQMQVIITAMPGVSPEFLDIQGFDNNGNEVRFPGNEPAVTTRALPDRRDLSDRRGDRDRDYSDRGDRDRVDRERGDQDRGDRGRGRGRGGRDRGGRGDRSGRDRGARRNDY